MCGRLQTGSYTAQDGTKRYTTDVVVDEHSFCESKGTTSETSATDEDGFMNVPDGVEDDGLPFS